MPSPPRCAACWRTANLRRAGPPRRGAARESATTPRTGALAVLLGALPCDEHDVVGEARQPRREAVEAACERRRCPRERRDRAEALARDGHDLEPGVLDELPKQRRRERPDVPEVCPVV